MHARRMTGRTVWHRSVDFRPPGREGTAATTRSAAGSTYGIRAGYVRVRAGVLPGVRRGVRPVGRRGVRPAVWGPAARAEVRAGAMPGAGPGSGGRNVAGRGAGDVFGGAARRTCPVARAGDVPGGAGWSAGWSDVAGRWAQATCPVGAAWGTCRVVGSGGVAGGAGRRTWPVGGRRRRVRWGCARDVPGSGGPAACPVVRGRGVPGSGARGMPGGAGRGRGPWCGAECGSARARDRGRWRGPECCPEPERKRLTAPNRAQSK